MAWLDLIVIVLIAVYVLSGLVKGFLKTSIRCGCDLFTLAVALLLAPTLSLLFTNVLHLNNDIALALNNTLAPYCTSSTSGAIDNVALHQFAEMALGQEYWVEYIDGVESPEFIAKLAYSAADSGILLISFFIIFAFLRIIISFICGLIRALNRKRAYGWIARTTGALVGVIEGILIVSVLFGTVIIISPIIPKYGETVNNLLAGNPITSAWYGLIRDFTNGVLLPWALK